MSGVYIKGMEMPWCEHQEIDIRRGADGKWYAIDGDWYEIVPVPNHGDLIDAQEVLLKIVQHDFATYFDYEMVFDTINTAPTNIPADTGGDA